jgi:hypothetical protein
MRKSYTNINFDYQKESNKLITDLAIFFEP